MKRAHENIERAIRDLPIRLDPQTRQETLGDAVNAHRASKQADFAGVAKGIGMFRWAVPSAAVCIVVAVLFTITLGGSSFTMADVSAQFERMGWVHVTYDTGPTEDMWISLDEGKFYYKRRDGIISFTDRSRNIRHSYFPGHSVLSEDAPRIYRKGETPPVWKPKSAWDMVARSDERHNSGVSETIDGRDLVRFDSYTADALGRNILVTQLWADPQTRLPVRMRHYMQLADRKRYGQDWQTAEYSFPQTGPTSIHDLGVPEGLPVVRRDSSSIFPEAAELMEAGKLAQARFAPSFRAVVWNTNDGRGVDIIYRRGDELRQDRYFTSITSGKDPNCSPLSMPTDAEAILQWASSQMAVESSLIAAADDGSFKVYRRCNSLWHDEREPTVRMMNASKRVGCDDVLISSLMAKGSWPNAYQWPYCYLAGPARVVHDAPDVPAEYVVLRLGSGNIRHDFWIDPARDHICVADIYAEEREGQWVTTDENILSDFRQLPNGQWYAVSRTFVRAGHPARNTTGYTTNGRVDIQLLSDDEFPEGVFDPDTLLEGAQLETY